MDELMIMSIKTKYANQIFDGTKKYEFRKKSIGEKNCNRKIYIYSSEIDKAITGYIIIDRILFGDIDSILKETNFYNNDEVKKYFNNCKECYALHIEESKRFVHPIKLEEIRNNYDFAIPQFYRYVKKTEPIYKVLKSRCIS